MWRFPRLPAPRVILFLGPFGWFVYMMGAMIVWMVVFEVWLCYILFYAIVKGVEYAIRWATPKVRAWRERHRS